MKNSIYILFALSAEKLPQVTPTQSTVQLIINFFLGLAGAITLLLLTISGFRYVISRGDSNAIKNAKESIIYSLVGLVIVMSAYGIVQFVFNGIKK